MRKKIIGEPATKAKKREIKKRPRMQMRGRGLRKATHAGKKLSGRR